MKVRVTLKDPDTMQDAVLEQAKMDSRDVPGLSDHEREVLAESRAETTCEVISHKWMEYGEYLVVEFDTEAMTAVVIENGK